MDVSNDLKHKMENTINVLKQTFAGIKVGKAQTSFITPVMVEVEGNKLPINQLATISVADEETISVQVWDRAMTKLIERAINEAKLGLSTNTSGQLIRLVMPSPSRELRERLVKKAADYAEDAKIGLRNIRRNTMENLKKDSKDKKSKVSDDEQRKINDNIQKSTDHYVEQVNKLLETKTKEILKI